MHCPVGDRSEMFVEGQGFLDGQPSWKVEDPQLQGPHSCIGWGLGSGEKKTESRVFLWEGTSHCKMLAARQGRGDRASR